MGGFGSGRTSGFSGRGTVEGCRSLDINILGRNGWLVDGWKGGVSWSSDREVVASIRLHTEGERVHLTYRVQVSGGDWEDIQESVRTVRVACRYGGSRPYFLCPGLVDGVVCGRRVAKLYAAGRYFLCRHCYRLSYTSQREDELDRANRRANNLKQRLHPRRIARLLEARAEGDDNALARDEPLLATLAAASLRARTALGPDAGQRWQRLGDRVEPQIAGADPEASPRVPQHGGMSLHADVAVPARDRRRLERLCRYVARPPLAHDRLEEWSDGRLALRLKTRWRDGTTHILMQRRAARAPRPAHPPAAGPPGSLPRRTRPLRQRPRAHRARAAAGTGTRRTPGRRANLRGEPGAGGNGPWGPEGQQPH